MTATAVTLPRPPQPVDVLDDLALVPVTPLLRLTAPGAPRWAWGCIARDLVGPHRRLPRVSEDWLIRGAPARKAGPRQIVVGHRDGWAKAWDETAGRMRDVRADVPVFRDGEYQDARPAVRPLQKVVDGCASQEVLVELVEILARLSGRGVGPAPDCVSELVTDRWPVMRSILGETAPPLRWSQPVRRKIPGGGLSPLDLPAVLFDIPRSAPAVERRVEGLEGSVGAVVASDGRLLALRALVGRCVGTGTEVDRAEVEALAGWVVGRERASVNPLDVAGQRPWVKEATWTGHREADRALSAADPAEVAELLLADAGAGVSEG